MAAQNGQKTGPNTAHGLQTGGEPVRTWGFVLNVTFVALYILASHIMLAFFVIIGASLLAAAMERFHAYALMYLPPSTAWWLWFGCLILAFALYGLGLVRAIGFVNHHLHPAEQPILYRARVPRRLKDMLHAWNPEDGPTPSPEQMRPSPEDVERYGFGRPPSGGSAGSKR